MRWTQGLSLSVVLRSSAKMCSNVVVFVTMIVLVFTARMCANGGATSAVCEFSGGLVLICTG